MWQRRQQSLCLCPAGSAGSLKAIQFFVHEFDTEHASLEENGTFFFYALRSRYSCQMVVNGSTEWQCSQGLQDAAAGMPSREKSHPHAGQGVPQSVEG